MKKYGVRKGRKERTKKNKAAVACGCSKYVVNVKLTFTKGKIFIRLNNLRMFCLNAHKKSVKEQHVSGDLFVFILFLQFFI